MYDHFKQYRCTIIRGKSQSKIDDLLPLYANIINAICPCDLKEFEISFNNAFCAALLIEPVKKTLDNHRTEIAGKLFGMYYSSEDGIVYSSERTKKFVLDSDTPAFFKDLCYKMQFPNGNQKISTLKDRTVNNINIRQYPFLLKVMMLAKNENIILTKKEIGYYILNSLDVLQGLANPLEVFDAIMADRSAGVERDISTPNKASSYDWQHINEQINLLELANLVIIERNFVHLNSRETDTIRLFSEKYATKPEFDVYAYNLDNTDDVRKFYLEWDIYFARVSNKVNYFDTSTEALGVPMEKDSDDNQEAKRSVSTLEIGDEGEKFVYEYEKRRVSAFNFRLANKVLLLGKTRGLGYDIQSVVAVEGDNAEFVKYIEVKSTKRVTAPNINDVTWVDTINITRNEWVASQQHRNSYSLFRVYFVRDSVIMFILNNIAQKQDDGIIQTVPITYRIDFSNDAVDEVIYTTGGNIVNA